MDPNCCCNICFALFFCINQTKFPVTPVYTQKNKAGKCPKFSNMLRASPTEKIWKSFISGTKWTKCVSSLQSGSFLQNHLHLWRLKYGRVLNKAQTHWFLLLLPSIFAVFPNRMAFPLFFPSRSLSRTLQQVERDYGRSGVCACEAYVHVIFRLKDHIERHLTEVLTNCPRQ